MSITKVAFAALLMMYFADRPSAKDAGLPGPPHMDGLTPFPFYPPCRSFSPLALSLLPYRWVVANHLLTARDRPPPCTRGLRDQLWEVANFLTRLHLGHRFGRRFDCLGQRSLPEAYDRP